MRPNGPISETREATPKRRVLIVDDDVDSAELLVQLLLTYGHDARAVHSASDALATAGEFQPEVAVLDVGLPDMTGYELAGRLRGCEGLALCKLIAATGYSGASELAKSQRSGFDVHLVKPLDLATLLGYVADDPAAAMHLRHASRE